jgi:hypothetical protein
MGLIAKMTPSMTAIVEDRLTVTVYPWFNTGAC